MTKANIELAIKCDALFDKVKNLLLNAAAIYNELWSYLKNLSITSFQLEKIITKIYQRGKLIEGLWEEFLEIKGDIPKTLYIYAQYQFKVMNDSKAAILLDKKAKREEIIQAQAQIGRASCRERVYVLV